MPHTTSSIPWQQARRVSARQQGVAEGAPRLASEPDTNILRKRNGLSMIPGLRRLRGDDQLFDPVHHPLVVRAFPVHSPAPWAPPELIAPFQDPLRCPPANLGLRDSPE